jgi:uncharacterized protein VirK/YbjX
MQVHHLELACTYLDVYLMRHFRFGAI